MVENSEQTQEKPKVLTRREFLKGAAVAGGALVLTSCVPGSKEAEQIIENEKPKYNEINNGEKISLMVNKESQQVEIRYQNYGGQEAGHIYARKNPTGEGYNTYPFCKNTLIRRKPGEIISTQLMKFAPSEQLPEDITVGIWQNPAGTRELERVGEIKHGEQVYGIKVITHAEQSWIGEDHPLPSEKNSQFYKIKKVDGEEQLVKDMPEGRVDTISRFHSGIGVGTFKDDVFTLLGFVQDGRALEEVK